MIDDSYLQLDLGFQHEYPNTWDKMLDRQNFWLFQGVEQFSLNQNVYNS